MDNSITVKQSLNELGIAFKNVGHAVLSTNNNAIMITSKKTKEEITKKLEDLKSKTNKQLNVITDSGIKIITDVKNFKINKIDGKINKLITIPKTIQLKVKKIIELYKQEYNRIFNELMLDSKKEGVVVKNVNKKFNTKQRITTNSKVMRITKTNYKKKNNIIKNIISNIKRKRNAKRLISPMISIKSDTNLNNNKVQYINPAFIKKVNKKVAKEMRKKSIMQLKSLKNNKVNLNKSKIAKVPKNVLEIIKENYFNIKDGLNIKVINVKQRFANSKLKMINKKGVKLDLKKQLNQEKVKALQAQIDIYKKMNMQGKIRQRSIGFVSVSNLIIFISIIITLIELIVVYLTIFN